MAIEHDRKRVAAFTQELDVPLTRDDLLERGQRLANKLRELEAHEAKADFLRKELKAEETKLREEVTALSDAIHSKKELREVACEGWLDYRRGLYEDIRTDTSEVLEGTMCRMTQEERQGKLTLETGNRGRRPPDIGPVRKAANEEEAPI